MARLGVTYQDIANAATQLIGQGRQPTIELIRHILGTGSTTTIANHLRKWRAEQDGTTSVATNDHMPHELVSVMKGLWERVQAHANHQIDIAKLQFDEMLAALTVDLEKYKSNNQRWQKLHDQWVREKDELSRDKLVLEQGLIAVEKDNTSLLAKFDTHQQQLTEKQFRIDELNRLHHQAQENLEHFRESSREQRLVEQEKHAKQVQQMESTLKQVEQQLQMANREKLQMQQLFNKSQDDNAVLEKQNHQLTAKVDSTHQALEKLQKNEIDLLSEAKLLQQQHHQLRSDYEKTAVQLSEHAKQIVILVEQLSSMKIEVQHLKDQNKLLAHEKWEIGQEKAQLEGQVRQIMLMKQKERA